MKPYFSSLDIPENGLGVLFFRKQRKRRRKREDILTYTATAKMPSFTYKLPPANVENGGNIVVTWSLLPFAFHEKMLNPSIGPIH